MIPWIELGGAPDFDQGIKLSGKVPFVTFEQLDKELPSDKAQTDYRNIILEILKRQDDVVFRMMLNTNKSTRKGLRLS